MGFLSSIEPPRRIPLRFLGATAAPLRRFGAARNGTAAVEFGLTGMMFMLVFCFIIEAGLTTFTQTALDEATRVASRLIRTGAITVTDSAGFVSALCAKLPTFQNCSALIQYNVVSGATFASLSTAVPTTSTNRMSGTQFTPGTTGQDVVVQVGWTRSIYFPLLKTFVGKNGYVLTVSTVAFQNEPF